MAAGHRERLRKRFMVEDIDNIPEYIVLEMLLTGGVRRRDTSELARELIAAFGSLAKVIDAPEAELLKIPGMGQSMVTHIKLIPKFYRKYRLSKWENRLVFHDLAHAGDYLVDKVIGFDHEVLVVLCMDSNCRVLATQKVFEGNINAVHVSMRQIVDTALHYNASRVIIAHNHLSGNALPSNEDLVTTRKVRDALEMVGVRLDDHIIIADDDYVSLSQSGFFAQI